MTSPAAATHWPTGRRAWPRPLTAGGYGLAQAKSGAMGLIDQAVQAQAQTLAYSDAFLIQKPKGDLSGAI